MKDKKNKEKEQESSEAAADLGDDMPLTEAETRKDIRIVTELESMVHGFDEDDEPWKEFTTILNISKSGAGFSLNRPCIVGRLIKLTTPMPPELRAFDHDEKLYTVVGLVQYCNRMESEEDDVYNVGVAFAGKDFPSSYFENPAQSYRISGNNPSGMWSVSESQAGFTNRRTARFRAQLDVTVSLMKKKGGASASNREDTTTHDISTNGACVVCSLPAEIGERVKFACKEHNFYAIAIVRNRGHRNNRPTLHLEFLESSYPVKKIPQFSTGDEQPPDE